jgi:hypothetical protein
MLQSLLSHASDRLLKAANDALPFITPTPRHAQAIRRGRSVWGDSAIVERPYSDRQLIVVLDDGLIEAARQAEQRVSSQAPAESEAKQTAGDSWARIGELTMAAFLPGMTVIADIAREAIKAWSRARASGLRVLAISKAEASAIAFPPGHPRDGVLYIGHPAMPRVYYTAAEFHRVTFEHKFAEAIELLMNLGATRIRVEHVTGWSKEFSSRLAVPLPSSGVTVGGNGGTSSASGTSLLYMATLDGTSCPRIPDGLVWYHHEPTWQSIAKGRTQFGLNQFSLTVSYEDDYGVNAGLKLAVLQAGLAIGGKFEDHQSTVWRIEGEFAVKL